MKRLVGIGLLVVTVLAFPRWEKLPEAAQSVASRMPVFEVDPAWPRLPNQWALGLVSDVTVDRQNHVWVLHRPRTAPANLKDRVAPPVLEFETSGKFLNAWGGDGAGYDWPGQEHGISTDQQGNVWIGGNADGDDMLLKFTRDGKFISQIGGRNKSSGNADVKTVNKAADLFIDPKTNEAFVADGYGNRRVIVFDAGTGAFKRMWAAFGKPPDALPPAPAPNRAAAQGQGAQPQGVQPPAVLDTEGDGPPLFGNPVHALKISNDGLVYVADRSNRRIQIFTSDGKYVRQVFINRAGPSTNSAAGIGFSSDPDQQFLYVADLGNGRIVVLNRKTLEVLYQFGKRGSAPGDFQGLHQMTVDQQGNIYTAEANPGSRAQKFVFKGVQSTVPANALPASGAGPR